MKDFLINWLASVSNLKLSIAALCMLFIFYGLLKVAYNVGYSAGLDDMYNDYRIIMHGEEDNDG